MIRKAERLEEMIRVFEPFPLEDDDFEQFYVETYDARGENAVRRMAFSLMHSQNQYIKLLFMGHRGSGKSTELFLLTKDIKDQFDVISFYIQDEVDVDSMTYIDFVFAIMAQLINYISVHPEMGAVEGELQDLYDYWFQEKIIEDIDYDSAEMKAGFSVKVDFLKRIVMEGGGILKSGSESKIKVRRKMEPKVGYLIQVLNQIIAKINSLLTNKGLIFIIEDLDKLKEDVAKGLFISHRKVLLSIKTRMILTFPIYMAYDVQYNMVKEDVDQCQMLSIIKVRDKEKNLFPKGIDILKEIVYKRADRTLFDDDALQFMILKSGGAMRDLFQMIRDAATEAYFAAHTCIEMSDVMIAYNKLKNEYERLIRNEVDVEKLKAIYEEPRLLMTDEIVMSLLHRGLVLEYNGERWCGIHPMIEDFLVEKDELIVQQD